MAADLPTCITEDFLSLQRGWVFTCKDLPEEEIWDHLRAYIIMLYRWSEQMNLISKNERTIIARKHIWRALAMLPMVSSVAHKTIIDVGSGSGLPAIPLKICLPDSMFYLVESRRRRANFLKEVVRRLGLKRIEIVNDRIENWLNVESNADVVTARAVSKPTEIMAWVRGAMRPSSHLVCTLEKDGENLSDSIVERVEWMGQTMSIGRFQIG
jgi:16S rRNA (guanine527-N7)-methyltransferase